MLDLTQGLQKLITDYTACVLCLISRQWGFALLPVKHQQLGVAILHDNSLP